MKVVVLALLVGAYAQDKISLREKVGAKKEEQFPFDGGFSPFTFPEPETRSSRSKGSTRSSRSSIYDDDDLTTGFGRNKLSVECEAESNFFRNSFREVKPVFTMKGEKRQYVGLDTPYSPDVNENALRQMIKENVAVDWWSDADTAAKDKASLIAEIRKLKLEDYDKNKDGKIQKEEFATMVNQVKAMQDKTEAAKITDNVATAAWAEMDEDKDGALVVKEVAKKAEPAARNLKVNTLKNAVGAKTREQEMSEETASGEIDPDKCKDCADLKLLRRRKEIFDTYFINMPGEANREKCITRQFHEAGVMEPKRFESVVLPDCAKAGFEEKKKKAGVPKNNTMFEKCLKQEGFADCIDGGVDYSGTATHGSSASHGDWEESQWHTRKAVIGNWCGHKRIWKQLETGELNNKDHEFFLVVEDDAIIDRKWFREVVEDFLLNYKGAGADWDMLQIDPFGDKDREHLLGYHRGKPVWRPKMEEPCGHYWGFQAVLVRKDGLKRINQWMSKNPAIPIDWVNVKMQNVIAYSAMIARNPEAKNSNSNSQQVSTDVVLPSFCSETIMRSSLARQKITEDMFAK